MKPVDSIQIPRKKIPSSFKRVYLWSVATDAIIIDKKISAGAAISHMLSVQNKHGVTKRYQTQGRRT